MKKLSHTSIAVIVGVAILAVQAMTGYIVFVLIPDWPTRGQFGDVFGVVNALFSGLAFTGLIYTVFLQREELSLQRKELELTRRELKRSAQAQEQSEVALRLQAEAASMSAKMNTAGALLEHYRTELEQIRTVVIPGNDPRRLLIKDLQNRERALLNILNDMYSQVVKEEVENE